MDTLYKRRPLRFGVILDGRLMGSPHYTSAAAEAHAEDLRGYSPWSVIEVEEQFA